MSDDNPSLPNGPEALSGNLPEYSVSEISNVLKRAVEETFSYVRVRGELSRVTRHASGHCYFDLKDDRAVLAAVVWKGSFARLRVKPEQGLEVVCTGRLTTFPGASKYQIVVEEVELAGLGALMAMLEDRKKRLAAEGLFDPSRKKPIPFLPAIIGVVTSPSGAVIRDIMHRLSDRCPRRVLLWPVMVQGERAAAEVVAAINGFNALSIDGPIPRPEVIIVARGGGSFEDLLVFSDEDVVRAAALSTIPLISAVGHETDTTLIDFVSDRRAPTPTAAAEMAVPVMRDCLENILSLQQRNLRAISRFTTRQKQHLQALTRALPRPDSLFALPRQRFDTASGRLGRALLQNLHRHSARFGKISAVLKPRVIAMEIQRSLQAIAVAGENLDRNFAYRLNRSAKELESAARILESVSYRAVLKRGFALVRSGHELRRNAAAIKLGEALTLVFSDGETKATASGKNEARHPREKKPEKSQGDLF